MSGQVALITGASRGIGKATALALAEAGSHLILTARNTGELDSVARACQARDVEAIALPCDVCRRDAVDAAISNGLARFGQLDVVVNNAGVGHLKPFMETSDDEWDHMFDVNVKGVYHVLQRVIPYFLAQGFGQIITVSSIRAYLPMANAATYTATKFAVRGLHLSLARELAPHGIKVVLIHPASTRTYFRGVEPETLDPRWLEAEDVARTVCYAATMPAGAVISELTVEPTTLRQ